MKKMIVIVGPTSTGKSELAISLAQKLNGEILSADSRQIYRLADVGTNKQPLSDAKLSTLVKSESRWIVNSISIWGYNVIYPDQEYSVSDFVNFAVAKIKDIVSQDKIPIVVGGTGYYIDALLGLSPYSDVAPNVGLRKKYKDSDTQEVVTALTKIDPATISELSQDALKNKQRMIRYLELAEAAGSVIAAKKYSPLKEDIYDLVKIGLNGERTKLYRRAETWAETIFDQGLVDEVSMLIDKGYRDTRLLHGIVYSPTVSLIDGELSREKALVMIKKTT